MMNVILKDKMNLFTSSDTESNKNTHLADFETCVFREYLRNHLSYKKVFYIYRKYFIVGPLSIVSPLESKLVL